MDHSHIVNVDVRFDWQRDLEANPKKMSVYFFPKGKNEGWRYDISNKEGGTIRVPMGVYDVLCFNNDSEITMLRNTNQWETLEVTTCETSKFSTFGVRSSPLPRAEGTSAERVVFPPDSLWCGSMRDITIEPAESADNSITLQPENAVHTCILTIRNVENVKYAAQFTATISSMVGGIHPADNSQTDETVTIPFDLVVQQDDNTITGTFQTYGHCIDNENTHQLIVYAVMNNGERY